MTSTRKFLPGKSLRDPPRPETLGLRTGCCTLCGTTDLPPRRRTWCSDECVQIWNIASSSEVALHHLIGLHGRACWACRAEWEPAPPDPWNRFGRVTGPARGHGWTATIEDRSALWCNRPTFGPPAPRRIVLEVEHIRPLWSLAPPERLELCWWLPYNLQLLCRTCHRRKTKIEAGQRAEFRRGGIPWRPVGADVGRDVPML